MIFSKIKKYFLQKRIEDTTKDKRNVFNVKSIKTIGVLSEKKLMQTYAFDIKVKDIFPNYKNVNTYSYKPFNKKEEKSFDCFSENDFNWRGNIIEPSLESFTNEKFDLLICYFDKNHLLLENLAKQSKASFKVGFANVNQNLFDLEIFEEIKNVQNFNLELKKYLQILGSN